MYQVERSPVNWNSFDRCRLGNYALDRLELNHRIFLVTQADWIRISTRRPASVVFGEIIIRLKHHFEMLNEFDYPENLLNTVKDVVNLFSPYSPRSMILIGSSSRGEFSFVPGSPCVKLLSDLEFLVVTDKELSRSSIEKIRNDLNEIEESVAGRTSFFHVDVAIISRRNLGSLPLSFHTYEMKNSGITLQGSDLINEIPDVSVANLDYKELNETIIWRLWALLLHFPVSLTSQKGKEADSKYYYLTARNILDITTWALPYEKVLIAGFANRVKYISEHADTLKVLTSLDSKIVDLLESCLRTKLRFEITYEVREIYGRALRIFANALRFLIRAPRCSDIDLIERLPKHSRRLFRDYRLRRKVYDAILLLKPRTFLTPFRALRWYFAGKHGMFAAWLLTMHLSMHEYLAGRREAAWELLENCRSFRYLLQFKGNDPKAENTEFLQAWTEMRASAADFMICYFRWAANQKNYLRKAVEEADA